MNVLIISPYRTDQVSRTCVEWARELASYAANLGHNVYSLIDIPLDRAYTESYVASACPCLIIFIGHGLSYGLLGSYDKLCALCTQSSPYLRGSVINAIACLSAQIFGAKIVEEGAAGFLGYSDDLLISYCAPDIPLNGFYECETAAARALLNGATLGEAYSFALQEYDRWIECYKSEDLIVAGFLQLNKDAFKLYGDPNYRPFEVECIAPALEPCNCSLPAVCAIKNQQIFIAAASIALFGLISMFKRG